MKIGILGTVVVGQTIGAELGHDVIIGTRDVAQTMARTDPGPYNLPPFSVWLAQHPGVRLGSFPESARHGELVINAHERHGLVGRASQVGRSQPQR
jgi:hypothetical protein